MRWFWAWRTDPVLYYSANGTDFYEYSYIVLPQLERSK